MVVALAVALPFLGHAQLLLLLDWGPSKQQLISRSAYGLDGGITAGLPLQTAVALLRRSFSEMKDWLLLVAFFPIAGLGTSRLLKDSGAAARLSAGVLFAVNPWVFDRAAVGQFGVLAAAAILPWTLASISRAPSRQRAGLLAGASWAGAAACSVHLLWIVGVVAFAVALQQRLRLRTLTCLAAAAGLTLLLSAYLVIPPLGQVRPGAVTGVDLAAYATRADPHLGLYGNVLGLYGFWRQGPQLPKDVVPLWPYLLAAILLVAGVGAWSALRDPARRPLASVLLMSGTAGYFLALGTQGPTGWLFRFLFDHIPFFQVMREPQKFLCLTALAYAVFFGWGAGQLLAWGTDRALKLALTVLVISLPIAYSPTFVNGLSGQVTGVTVPTGFAQADHLMGSGPEQILFLPWHQYLSFPWTGRVVANPGPALFHREVIVGDNVELPGVYSTSTSTRSAYLQGLYATGAGQSDFGSNVARLGVRYVAVAKTLDWQYFDWLHAQSDLRVVLDTPDLALYEVTTRVDLGARIAPDGTRGAAVRRRSPVTYDVPPGPPGQVELAEPYDAAWRLGGAPPVRTEQGTMRFPVGTGATTARFTHWPLTLAGHLISITTALVLVAVLLRDRRRRRRAEPLAADSNAGTRPQ